TRRRPEDHGTSPALPLHGLRDRVPDREALVRRAPLAGCHAADDERTVLLAARGVEGALASGDALHQHASRAVDQNAHSALPSRVGAPLLEQIDDFLVTAGGGGRRLFPDLITQGGVPCPAPPPHCVYEALPLTGPAG